MQGDACREPGVWPKELSRALQLPCGHLSRQKSVCPSLPPLPGLAVAARRASAVL